MNDHIKQICKQASNKLYALARIFHYLDKQKRKMLMKSFVISQFNYCPIIWMHCQRKSNNLINKIHERALRIAYNDYVSNFDQLLENDNSVTIHHRNIQALATEIYKTLNDLNPLFMKEVFSLKAHCYPLRTQNLIYPNPCTVLYGLESFGYRVAKYGKVFLEKFKKVKVYPFLKLLSQKCAKIFANAIYVNSISVIWGTERSTT